VFLACANNPENCRTEVFLTSNCTGSSIATVIIDARKAPLGNGFKSVAMHDNAYIIKGDRFTFEISPVA
jgi:hypothetical protein